MAPRDSATTSTSALEPRCSALSLSAMAPPSGPTPSSSPMYRRTPPPSESRPASPVSARPHQPDGHAILTTRPLRGGGRPPYQETDRCLLPRSLPFAHPEEPRPHPDMA